MSKYSLSQNTWGSESGFTTLVSVLIITSILLASFLSANVLVLGRLTGSSEYSEKQASRELARACVDHALLRYAINPMYQGNERVAVGQEFCEIEPLNNGQESILLNTSAVVNHSLTILQTRIELSGLKIISQQEIPLSP
jgi:hypothetical protein